MTEATATARDFADTSDDMGDEAVAAAFASATPQAQFPSGFTMNKDGLFLEGDNGPSRVAGSFQVVAQTRDRHSQSWGVLLRWQDDDGQQHQLSIARSMMAGDGREVRHALLDGGLYVSPFAKDRNALQTFLGSVKIARRARAVSRVGWQEGSFALPDRTIESGGGDLVVYQGSAVIDHEYRAGGSLEGWQGSVAKFGEGNSRVALAICAAFVGPLLGAVGEEGGGIHFRGPSSIGKSTALLAAASVWGPPSFVRQWRATQNGLEGLAEQSNETLLILDELAQLDAREAGSVAYLLANGTGKARASQTGEARAAKRWLAFFLSSGEISLAEHARSDGYGRRSPAGQEVRILDVEADAGSGFGLFNTLHVAATGDELARSIKAGAAEHYGLAGPAFVERLLGDLGPKSKRIREGIDLFVESNRPQGSTGQVARACRRFGLVAMAGELAISLGVLPWPRGEAVDAARVVFAGWLEARGGAGAHEDRSAVEQVAEFLSTHGASRFQPLHGDGPLVVHNRAGFWRDNGLGSREYLIPTPTWRNEVCRGLSAKAVSGLLLKLGHLTPDSMGKASVTVTAPGMGKARFYIVNQSIFGGDDA